MEKIDTLTPAQEALMDEVILQYENNALGGDDSYDIEEMKKSVTFLYKLADLPCPAIYVCTSPKDLTEKSGLKEGEKFDYNGIGYDSGWTAFYDYMERIGVKYDETFHFAEWKNFILKSGIFCTVLYEKAAFVCVRPIAVHRNKEYVLHNPNGMAIEWRDGYGEYYLNGVQVTEEIVMTPAEQLDAHLVVKEKNVEVRREIVRKVGIEKVCKDLGAKVIEEGLDHCGQPCQLLGLDLGDGRIRPYIKLKNPSVDGIFHIEGVHPACETLEDAFKFRNGTNVKPSALS